MREMLSQKNKTALAHLQDGLHHGLQSPQQAVFQIPTGGKDHELIVCTEHQLHPEDGFPGGAIGLQGKRSKGR